MTRDQFIEQLGAEYRRVLAGAEGESAFGRRLVRARLTPREMAAVVRIALAGGEAVEVAADDLTLGGEKYLEVY